jgi:hypothetical protein
VKRKEKTEKGDGRRGKGKWVWGRKNDREGEHFFKTLSCFSFPLKNYSTKCGKAHCQYRKLCLAIQRVMFIAQSPIPEKSSGPCTEIFYIPRYHKTLPVPVVRRFTFPHAGKISGSWLEIVSFIVYVDYAPGLMIFLDNSKYSIEAATS